MPKHKKPTLENQPHPEISPVTVDDILSQYLTVDQYAQLMNISRRRVLNLIYKNKIHYVKPYKFPLIPVEFALKKLSQRVYLTDEEMDTKVSNMILEDNKKRAERKPPKKNAKPKQ